MNADDGRPPEYAALYRRAFREHGRRALWNMREAPEPTPEDALAITMALRVEGDMVARALAEAIEKACHATV